MSTTSDILFAYLREIFYGTAGAELDLEKIEEDYITFGKALMFFAECFHQYHDFAYSLSRGDLSAPAPPPENELAAPLKSLHASLKHLTWQSQQVAKGDYKQHMDFMGEFSDAFNTMVKQLSERQQRLESEITITRRHTSALEQGNKLLSNVTQYIPQQIFVISEENREILLMNDMAEREFDNDPHYLAKLIKLLPLREGNSSFNNQEVLFNWDDLERYLSVSAYHIEWDQTSAVALVINDISVEKKQLIELENHAYRDSMTHVFNRFYGMMTLNDWLNERKRFAMIFIDMDNLKYVNDKYGHKDGDEYIIRVSKHLQTFSRSGMVCRVGGDEFMLLVPDIDDKHAHARMDEIQDAIQNDEYLHDKDYYYSVSYGIVALDESSDMSSSEILSIADERMYEHKRARKKERQN